MNSTSVLSLARFAGRTGRDVRVAVVDTGIHADHPHVGGIDGACGFDADGEPTPDLIDRLGHGTAVAAAIREKAPEVRLLAAKVFDRRLATTGAALVAGIRWAAEQDVHLINLSLGTANPAHRDALADAVAYAEARGAIVVAAAPQPESAWLPGGLPGVVAVEVDWTCPREDCHVRIDAGRISLRASGYPRPIPGVPPEQNVSGISFAVANATGFLALALQDALGRGIHALEQLLAPRKRRPRYAGKNPRAFHEKYKELNPERYAAEFEKVIAAGKTPAGAHRSIMVDEILDVVRPAKGELAVDCTLGRGGHTRALLDRVLPGGRVVALDLDPLELPRTEASLRAAGFGPDVLTVRRTNFAGLPKVLAECGSLADVIVADLGVSSMQLDNPDRGFGFKEDGPLDMRMNPARGEPASSLVARMSEDDLAAILLENADEPFAADIARVLKHLPDSAPASTRGTAAAIRAGLLTAHPHLSDVDVTLSVRRTFQALRIAVNDELAALDALLRALPFCLAAGGRAAILTFHSGEDRRVKRAFQAGHRDGTYVDVAREVIRPSARERRGNPRASSAKLRWAIRAAP